MSETRFSISEIVALARSAVTKVDVYGVRGATLVTVDETIAMALVLSTPEILTTDDVRTAEEASK
ncbi:MAG: hypothetical protein AAF230_00080 [Pseudomonadota bacterium]